MTNALGALAAALRAEGGLVAGAVDAPDPATPTIHGAIAAAGPRARGQEAAYAEIVEAVREGHLVHTRAGSAGRFVTTTDEDLALLVGDRLYALGLSRLAELGDLDAVAELADVIVLGAQAHATGDEELGEAAWEAGSHAVGHGSTAALQTAKIAARMGDPSAAPALRAAARQLAAAGADPPTPPTSLTQR
ncbi:MAG: hypothetical protein JWO02_802 [Solirubrobacterales bacterium]|nr:hypothetical protein [Solirubrobacterales bacterium]